jgi:hypothetical protein
MMTYADGGMVTGPTRVTIHEDLVIPYSNYEKFRIAWDAYLKAIGCGPTKEQLFGIPYKSR